MLPPNADISFPLKDAFEKARCTIPELGLPPPDCAPDATSFGTDVGALMPPLEATPDEKPFLEFLGRRIYGYGRSSDVHDYPTLGVFYVPGGQIIDG